MDVNKNTSSSSLSKSVIKQQQSTPNRPSPAVNDSPKSSASSAKAAGSSSSNKNKTLFPSSSVSAGRTGSNSARGSRGSGDANANASAGSNEGRRNSAQGPSRRLALIPVLDFGGEFESSPSSALIGAHELYDLEAHFNEAAASRQMSSSKKMLGLVQDVKSIFVKSPKGGGGSDGQNSGLPKGGGGSTSALPQQSQPVGTPATPADKAAVTQAVIDGWMQTFDAVLFHKVGLDLFRHFLRSEFSEENIEFWIACENYRQVEEELIEDNAAQIYENFVNESAPKEINLDATTRKDCAKLMESPNRDTFDQAQKRIRALMERDSYQRFLQSSTFENFVKEKSKTIQR